MDNSGDAQNPMFLVALLHQTFPQFAERDPKGALKQQDANEAWLSLAQYLNMMKVRGYTDNIADTYHMLHMEL